MNKHGDWYELEDKIMHFYEIDISNSTECPYKYRDELRYSTFFIPDKLFGPFISRKE